MMMVIRSTGYPASRRNLQNPAINWSDDSSFQASLRSQPASELACMLSTLLSRKATSSSPS